VFRVAFLEPKIPPNTGNAIRTAAVTGCELHLIGPLAFEFSDARLRRAGLDYHDLASVTVHADLDTAWVALMPARVFAFTARANRSYADIRNRPVWRRLPSPTRTSRTQSGSRCSPAADRSISPTRPLSPFMRHGGNTASLAAHRTVHSRTGLGR
jgi:hypothetical protein